MKHVPFPALRCPLCQLPLAGDRKTARCAEGHAFDFDRKGAINLLPVQFKKSLHPGDTREMVLARRDFLDTGLYAPISEALNGLVAQYAARSNRMFTVLDAGCGEGYYTNRLTQFLGELDYTPDFAVAGLDISKEAIKAASTRSRDIQWLVASNKSLPVPDNMVDCVLSLFGFPVWPEFARVLKTAGAVIVAEAGPEHLIELRRVLYPEIKEKPPGEPSPPEGVRLVHRVELKDGFVLDDPQCITDLIAMTPHGYRATLENKEKARQTVFPHVTIEVVFKVYSC